MAEEGRRPGRAQRSGRARREVQRVAAYAVVVRDGKILMSRLAERLTKEELWTLPGGGIDHGESPRDAVVREVFEETGLPVTIGEHAHVYSFHQPHAWRQGRRADAHAVRIVYDGWVPADAPEPHVTEVDGSTAEARWLPLAEVLDGTVPTVALVTEALADHRPARVQRVAAYALVVRDESVLLTRLSARGPFPGSWSLPGGGIGHGEAPREAVLREVVEETGLTCVLGEVLEVDDHAFEGTAPHGRHEDFHAVSVVFSATVVDTGAPGEPRVVETDGTTAEAAWVPLDDLGSLPVLDLVHQALKARERRLS